jgi:hypothetical protein
MRCNGRGIRILCAPGQNLVADDQQGCRDDAFFGQQ